MLDLSTDKVAASRLRELLGNKNKLVKQEAKDGTRNQYQVEIERIKKRLKNSGLSFGKIMKLAKSDTDLSSSKVDWKRKEQKFLDEESPFSNQMNAILGSKKSLVEKGDYGSKIQTLKEKIKSYNADHELVGKEKVKFKDILRKSQLSQDMNKKDLSKKKEIKTGPGSK
tara:strand:- start:19 stop:525 length:507 start_codon:yes stop_codon:yes gene_type:complete